MKKPPKEMVAAFLEWYRNDPHAGNEDYYVEKITRDALSGLPRDQFIEFFFQFSRDGGMVQSGGHRTAPRFRETIEAKYDDFRSFVLQSFGAGFDEVKWLDRIQEFNGFGQGLATIYLNRVDKKRFAIINNKAVEAVGLFGVGVPGALGKKYEEVRNAERQLIEWFPEVENFYRADALSQFLIGEKQGVRWAEQLRGNGPREENQYWIYAPGEKARLWDQYYHEGVMGFGWGPLDRDLADLKTEKQLRKVYDVANGDRATGIDFRQGCDFLLKMREGDLVFVKRGTNEIVGYGEVSSGYFYDGSRPEYPHLRKAKWLKIGHWTVPNEMKGLPVKALTEVKDPARAHELMRLIGSASIIPGETGKPLFGEKAFALLNQLHEKPETSFYNEHAEEFSDAIEKPLQQLMSSVAEKLPAQMSELLETEKRLFSRIPKNDYGRGGAWDYYWGAFYPKGGKRIAGPQLFAWLNKDLLRFGFYVGDYGQDATSRFLKNCEGNLAALRQVLKIPLSDENFIFGNYDAERKGRLPATEDKPPSWEEWLSDPEAFGVRVDSALPSDQLLKLPAEELVRQVTTVFSRLFPLVMLAHYDEPIQAIRQHLDAGTAPSEPNPIYTLDLLATETHQTYADVEQWVRAVRRKKQAILYGPPGTGKTFVAQRLAKHLIGGGDGISEVLQFHPSYAYEDFIQGLRPKALKSGGLEYALVPGRFMDFCTRARECSGSCVLIVDEINRANLSRVLGELMYLLEYRKESMPLAGGERFQIPENVFIIGTMNTADRSIALVDHALRRRFAFLALYPDYEVLKRFYTDTGFDPTGLIGVLERLNTAINDKHYSLGVSFFLDRDIRTHVQDVWQMEIEPYIEELFFDQPDKTASFKWEKVAKDIVGE